MKKVSKVEFEAFIKAFHDDLQDTFVAMSEPPCTLYLSKDKNSVEAKIVHYESYPKDTSMAPYTWAPNVYAIAQSPESLATMYSGN